MKVLMLNGSSRDNGCTYTALQEIATVLEKKGIDSEIISIGIKPIRDCIACGACSKLDQACVFDDDIINEIIQKAKDADGFIFGSPVYYAHPSGRLLSVLDRAFYAGKSAFAHKPGASIVSARRAGTTASFDVINKYFTIAEMPVISSSYWNMVHGSSPEDVKKDLEGLQTMRNLGQNMAWILNCIEAGKKQGIEVPETEATFRTNFIQN